MYQKPLERPYFYKDSDGNSKKYYYCSLCLKGPFKEDDMGKKIFYMTGQETRVYYCFTCKNEQSEIPIGV